MERERTMKPILMTTLCGALFVSACTQSNDRVLTQFFREAGDVVDGGNFGNATLNNQLAQSGRPGDFAVDLNKRFTAEVDTMVNFAFNSARLDGAAMEALTQQADWIRQFPEVKFRVYGHTDLVGSDGYNKRLGLRRAQNAVNFLVAQGIHRSRLEAVASFGETRPIVDTQNRERRNRRTVTQVSGFVGTHPQVLNGRYAQIVYRDYVASAQAATGLTGIQGRDLRTER
jgi:outer membrane protein OmpA-like peptidoglycan-associated protein